jgi:transposase InsO family protein
MATGIFSSRPHSLKGACVVRSQLFESLAQHQLGATQPCVRRVQRDLEHARDLAPVEPLPEGELEHQLRLERNASQRFGQQALLLTLGDDARGRCAEPRDRVAACGRHRVARLMRYEGIVSRTQKHFRWTSTKRSELPAAPDRLKRCFRATEPNRVWVSDITYLRTGQGWLFLAIVLDLYSRRIVG